MSGLPTAPDTEIGFQPPPSFASPIGRVGKGILPPVTPVLGEVPIHFNPVIILLTGYLEKAEPGGLDKAVASAYEQIPEFMDKLKIHDSRSFLIFANDLLKWIPTESYEGKDIYNILCMFYFVMDQPPLKDLQTEINPEEVGQPLTWLSSWMVVYAQLIGLFMDTPASITPDSLQTFKDSPKYNYEEALVPPDGFRTFNEFFYRKLKPGARPISKPEKDEVIVYPADCTYDNSVSNQSIVDVQSDGHIYIKGLPWTISSLLQGSEFAECFHGGVWMHAFLNAFNYHRQHTPVSGTVIEVKNIQGACYLEVNSKCEPFLQTRGLCVIENKTLGKVAVLPIGMAQVSSVNMTVKVGDELKKGDGISYFAFGGSDIICVFQPQANLKPEDFVASSDGTYSKMGTVLARAPKVV
ncbi:hypothetical protein CEP52_009137 [Fusarium oligoseptatum]|uniref:Phosphatidylserine decarboxylase n=1 Tax=Fusarium oligoseptatum TaxID=2604345 RepID=A0A428TEF6_9HYPO|nr:hypothetical protein CEP52_009137 [Fusarium oligoseptatum]